MTLHWNQAQRALHERLTLSEERRVSVNHAAALNQPPLTSGVRFEVPRSFARDASG